MTKPRVAVVTYEQPLESVRKAVELSGGFPRLAPGAKVFVKPNIVVWFKAVPFPKWGVLTTSRVVHDTVRLLKEHGADHITIGEGMSMYDAKDRDTPRHAFETLGYNALRSRYGVNVIDVLDRPFRKVDLGDGVELKFNEDVLESDFVVDLPVMKTHAQTVVSLGIKNIKGTMDVTSRKKCHSADPEKDLNYMLSKLANKLPWSFSLIDGIYANERGPGFDGRIHRSNLLVASSDMFSADKVGSVLLGYHPSQVPHLVHAALDRGRTTDLADLEVVGEPIEKVAMKLEYSFSYNEEGTLPIQMEKMGIRGLSYPKYDLTMCTYCSMITGAIIMSIAYAWKGEPWNDVEVLTGKIMEPTPGKKTILMGKCLYEAHKGHPDIKNMIAVKSCPPSPKAVVKALHEAGVDVNPAIFENLDKAPGFFMRKYEGKPEFDESFFRVE